MAEVLRNAGGRQGVTDEMTEQDRDPPTGCGRQLRPGRQHLWDCWLHGASRSNQPRQVTRHDQPVAAWSPKIALQTCLCWWMENRIKECQLDLFADRTSTATMQANQLRLWFASMAYVLLCALRRIGLAHTQFAEATCGTIRLKLLKLGALVRVSVRRIKTAMASACPSQDAFALAQARLRNACV